MSKLKNANIVEYFRLLERLHGQLRRGEMSYSVHYSEILALETWALNHIGYIPGESDLLVAKSA